MKMTQVNPLLIFALGSAMTVAAGAQGAATGTTDGIAQPSQAIPSASQPGQSMNSNSGSYATGKPLAGQSREGFWGKVNPFARKKWVNRQVDPIKDRTNELDELQAKNANDIRDVDTRSQAGINKALSSANTADQHATDANSRANTAQGVATDASNRTNALNSTVSNLDQYQTVAALPVTFAPGRTTLGPKGKADLDAMAEKLASEKGYIIEVQGFSRSGVQSSQAMADAVTRYLVVEHQVPVYRIYRTGLGKSTHKSADGEKPLNNGVMVSVMHNSLATMDNTNASVTQPTTGAQGMSAVTGVSKPDTN